MERKIALSIAGSDSSGGAGIQADIKSFSYLKVHGLTVITCVTAQNTQQVHNIHVMPLDMIEQQLDTLLQDFHIHAAKTGMLYDESIIKLVAKKLTEYHIKPIIDPVMVATSGDLLVDESFVASLKRDLLPRGLMITANVPEASVLADMKISSQDDVRKACKKISSYGPTYVLLKGGHLKDDQVIDVLYDGKTFHSFTLPRIAKRKAHGSGCTLSGLITGLLAAGETPIDAVQKAKHIVWGMIEQGYSPGKGSDVLNHFSDVHVPPVTQNHIQHVVWFELKNAITQLTQMLPVQFIPEVGMNFAYAIPKAKKREDVCAIDGRITAQKQRPVLCGTINFGVSKHVAAIVLAAMSSEPTMRSAMNIRFSHKTVDLCRTIGFVAGTFERSDEPANVSSTMEWGTNHAIMKLGRIPDIIYDTGSVGKEPMIRILGTTPHDVLLKLQKIIHASLP